MKDVVALIRADKYIPGLDLGDEQINCLREIGGGSVIAHILNALDTMGIEAKIVSSASNDTKGIRSVVGEQADVIGVEREKTFVTTLKKSLKRIDEEYVIILSCEYVAFLTPETILNFIRALRKSGNEVGVMRSGGEVNYGVSVCSVKWLRETMEHAKEENFEELLKSASAQAFVYTLKDLSECLPITNILEWDAADKLMWFKNRDLPIARFDRASLSDNKPLIIWDMDGTLLDTKIHKEKDIQPVLKKISADLDIGRLDAGCREKGMFNYRKFIWEIAAKSQKDSAEVARMINKTHIKNVNKRVMKKTSEIVQNKKYDHILITFGQIYLQKLKAENIEVLRKMKRIYFTEVSKEFVFNTNRLESDVLLEREVYVINDNITENEAYAALLPNASVYESPDIISGKIEIGM